jgi:4-amino-4-deoxy-L-arabinose transferase-like glycosyltransferase
MPRDSRFRASIPVLLLAFALRVHHLDLQSIWWDEGHSIEMASAPLSQIATLPGMDVHPPGYFWVLHGWMATAGQSEFALRYLSVIFSLLTVALLMHVGWRMARQMGRQSRAALTLVGILAAIYPLYVAYAQEVRMYAMVTPFALLSGYAQWRIVFEHQDQGRSPGHRRLNVWWMGYVLATTVSLYTHYFMVFLLAFQNLVWLAWVLKDRETATTLDVWQGRLNQRQQRIVFWIGSQLAVLILFLPQLSLALGQTTAYANPNLRPPGLVEFISRSWLAYSVGTNVFPGMAWLAGAVAAATGLTVLAWLWMALRARDRCHPGTLALLVGWFCVPLALYFAVLQRRPSFEPRYMMLVTPSLLLLWGVGLGARIEGWPPGRNRLLRLPQAVLAAVVVAALGMGTTSYFTNTAAFKDDSAGVVAWLAAETTPDDLVYVDVPHPFHYYADRIPAPTGYLFVDVHAAAQTLNAEAAGRRRIYWVRWWGSDTDPRGIMPYLLDKAGQRGGDTNFRGYRVRWWDMPSDAEFSLPDDLTPADYTFGDTVHLDGVAFSDSAPAGGTVWVTLHFSLLGDTAADYRASLRLRDAQGNMLPPTDKDLLNDRHFRTSAWPLADGRLNHAINVYTLPIPADGAPGDYRLEVVLYQAGTLEALPVDDDSSIDGFSATMGTVTILP